MENKTFFKSKEKRLTLFIAGTVCMLLIFGSYYLNAQVPSPQNIRNANGQGIEIATRAIIAMDFSPMSGRWIYGGTDQESYYKIIGDMRALGIDCLAQDYFDAARDHTHNIAIAAAVRQWNVDHNDNFCWCLFPETLNFPTATMIADFKQYAHGPDYCYKNGKPLFLNYGTFHKTTASWISDVLTPLKNDGFEPHFVWHGSTWTPQQISVAFTQIRNAGFDVDYFDFSVDPYTEASKDILDRINVISPSKIIPGLSCAYSRQCGKGNQQSTGYMEHFGYEGGLLPYMQAMLSGGIYNNPEIIAVTIWDDFGEDTYFSPYSYPCGSPYTSEECAGKFNANPDMPNWSHIGYYEFLRRYFKWYKAGTDPGITKDRIYYTYRQHPKDMPAPSGDECVEYGNPVTGTANAEDVIYITTELTAAATLSVTLGGVQIGSWNLSAGTSSKKAYWGPNRGRPTFTLTRSGSTIISNQGKLNITDTPKALDGQGSRNFNHYADFAEAAEHLQQM